MFTMFIRLLVASLITTHVRSFQHLSFSSTSRASSGSFFALSSASFSQDLSSSSSSTTTATTKSDIEIQKNNNSSTKNDGGQRRKKKRRRRRIPASPSQDVNFLLKRTQYLLDLTPSSLQEQSVTEDEEEEKTSESRGHHKLKIHRHTFHWLIDAWANSYHSKATFYARSLLDQMIELSSCPSSLTASTSPIQSRNHNNHLQKLITPNVRSYTKVMHAYSKEGKNDSGEKAYKLLQEMMKLDDKRNQNNNNNDSECNEQHNTYLKPNVITYTSVLEAYANSGTPESAFRAEELCMEMINNVIRKSVETGFDATHFKVDQQGQNDLIQPTTRSYNAVIQAYSNSGMYDRAERAEAFIKQIETLHQQHMNNNQNIITPPNTINYNTILTTYANSGLQDAAEHTERILKKVMTQPNVISYNACIDAWAKSGFSNSGEKAFSLLQEMNELYETTKDENVKPNTRSYNSVMNAYAKSSSQDGPQKAEQILDKMEELFENGNEDVKPDFFSFATVINAWGRSYQFGKAQRVLNIFRHMIDLYEKGNESVRPNVVIYNAIINACAYTIGDISEQRRAMEIAHYTLQELKKSPYAKADQVTYGTFLKVCENQMPPSDSRRQLVNVVFRRCAKDGQMGKLVVDQLKSILTPEQFEEIIGFSATDHTKGWKDLPLQWRCNVVEGKKRRRTRLH